MEKTCFVVMPFGGQFDEIYHEIYKPAIQAMGLKPLRADDIYDNRPIIQDSNTKLCLIVFIEGVFM